MPRNKMNRQSTLVDMTAMTDMVFLLLNFFIMSSHFIPPEPVAVITPSSINSDILPDSDVILVRIDKAGRVFFDMDGQPKRKKLIEDIDQNFLLGLDQHEKNGYMLGASIGTELKQLKKYLHIKPAERKHYAGETGIPVDSANNELSIWIVYGLAAQQGSLRSLKYCIMADRDTPFPKVKRVLDIFKENKIHKVSLVTSLEAVPS